MSDNIEAGAPEGIYSVKMEPSDTPWNGGTDHRADRIWLAGMAMQALLAQGSTDVYRIAHQSYAMADAMLEVEESAFTD
jgi:hypothetical protein